jgi:hypothetical protein
VELVARQISVGAVLAEWTAMLRRNWLVVLGSYALFGVVIAAIDVGLQELLAANGDADALFPGATLATMTISGLAGFVVYYFVLERVLLAEGLMEPGGERRLASLLGASITSGIGITLGLIFLVVPGLILMARWSIMGACIIANGKNADAGLGESWAATANSQGSLTAVVLIFFVVQIAAGVGVGLALGSFGEELVLPGLSADYAIQSLSEQVINSLGNGLFTLLAAAIFRLFANPRRELDAVFA